MKKEEFKKKDVQNPYESDKLAKIPSWIKILLLKYWAAAAAYYFFGIANPLVSPDSSIAPDMYYVWISLGLALLLEFIVKTLVRFMRNSRDDTYRYNMINRKGVVSLLLHLVYAFIANGFVMLVLLFLAGKGWILDLLKLDENSAAIEPFTAGLVFIVVDAIFVFGKFLIVRGWKKYKNYKNEKEAKKIIEELDEDKKE